MTLISWYSFVRPSRRRLTQDEARRTTFATGLLGPEGLAFGPNGDLYVANNFDGMDEVTPTGEATDIASGPAFGDPRGIAIDAADNMYVANSGSGTIVKLTPAGECARHEREKGSRKRWVKSLPCGFWNRQSYG